MSWNGSDNANAAAAPKNTAKTPPSKWRGLIALAAVVIGGIVALYLVLGRETAPQSTPKKAAAKKAAPAKLVLPPTNAVKRVFKNPLDETPEERLAYFERRYGTNIPERLKTTVYFLKHPPTHVYRPPPRREDIFQHHSERVIASALLMHPGAFVMQRVTYDERFDENFKKALDEPTLFSKDDTPEERELKEAVNDVKAELAERMRNGEKPSEIMTQVMEDAYELGKYRTEMESLVREMRDDPTKSDQDYEDFVAAANKLLREKGADELHLKTVVSRQARLRHLARQRAEEEQTDSKEDK